MSTRGVNFMHEWVDVHVTDAWRPASADFLAALLRNCLAAAAAQGITVDEIEDKLGSDIRTIIFDALMNDPNNEFESPFRRRLH